MTTTIEPISAQPLKWHGGKSYLADWLHSLAPPSIHDNPTDGYTHRLHVFAGGLAELWHWEPVDGVAEAVNDLFGDLSNFWQVLANEDHFDRFYRILEVTPLSQVIWEQSNGQLDDPVKRAAQFFVRYRQSRQGVGKDYTTPTSRTRRGMNEQVSAWLSAVKGLPQCHARLRRVEVRNLDFEKFIKTYDHPRALFYLDPPYLHETRSSTGEYQHEMTVTDHRRLLDCLTTIQGRFMLSGYPSDLYDQYTTKHGWNCHQKSIDNKASGSRTKEKRTECCWTNYEATRPMSNGCLFD